MVCQKCGSTEYVTSVSGPHIKASCAKCGTFLKFMPQPDPVMPIGKHRGKKFSEIPRVYMEWASHNIDGNLGIRIRGWIAEHSV